MKRETIMRMLSSAQEAMLPDLDETGCEALEVHSTFSQKVMIIKQHLKQKDHPLRETLAKFE